MLKNKIIVYGGTFNPPGYHHLKIIKYLLKLKPYRLLIIPTDDKYEKEDLISLEHRIKMLEILTKKLDDVEILVYPKPNIKTIQYLSDIKRKYQKDIYFALGTDNLEYLHNWYKSEQLVKNYRFIVFNRQIKAQLIIDNNEFLLKYKHHFIICENQNKENLSSTLIRDKIHTKQVCNIDQYIDPIVFDYIKERGLYSGKENI